MKRSYKLLTTALVAGALIAGGAFVNSTMASQDDEKMATKAIQEYVTGFKNGDVEAMTSHIKDTRVKDESQLNEKYKKYVKENKERNAELKFVSVEKADGDKFIANFEYSTNEFKATPLQLPVIKDENGDWKLFVDGSVSLKPNK